MEESHHREAVLHVAVPESFNLHGILYRLPPLYGRRTGYEPCLADQRAEVVVKSIRIRQDSSVEFAERNLRLFVITEKDAILLKFSEGGLCHGILHNFLLHEPLGGLRSYEQE